MLDKPNTNGRYVKPDSGKNKDVSILNIHGYIAHLSEISIQRKNKDRRYNMDIGHERNTAMRRMAILVLILFTIVTLTGIPALTFGGSNGLTIAVTAENLQVPSEVTLVKIEDGIVAYEQTLTTSYVDGAYVARFPGITPGGMCIITGSLVPGYLPPEQIEMSLNKIKGKTTVEVVLTYVAQDIPVAGIEMAPTDLDLIVGETAQIDAYVLPLNASEQDLVWSVDYADGILFDNGLVTAVDSCSTAVTAMTVDGDFEQTCTINVWEILSIAPPDSIGAGTGETIILPATCLANLTNGIGTMEEQIPIGWIGASLLDGEQIIIFDVPGTYTLTGETPGSAVTVSLTIDVIGETVVSSPDSITLSATQLSVFYGIPEHVQPLSIISWTPEDADLSTLVWSIEDESVATLNRLSDTEYQVIGVGPGTTYVRIHTWDGTPMANCLISVALDPELTDAAYIEATTCDCPDPVDQFACKEEVFIRCYNLPPGEYYIKVEDKGTDNLLLPGNPGDPGFEFPTVTVEADPSEGVFKFNLDEKTHFLLTDNYSKSYFVSMSMNDDFPSGDDENGIPKTFMDNFKIESPVPTTLLDNIHVTVKEFDPVSNDFFVPPEFIGNDVILARELEMPAGLTEYEDYLDENKESGYLDEVKLIGTVMEDGTVSWNPPKELLKIGGYYLLIEIPMEDELPLFITNLNLVNPESEEAALLKEVHVLRNTPIYREIIVEHID